MGAQAARREGGVRSALELLPWLVPISDGLIICKDGGMLACYEITGLDLDGSDADQQRELAAAADRFMACFRDRPVNLWWTVHRRQAADYPEGQFASPVAARMDADNRATFEAGGNYRNRHFVSVLWLPPTGASGLMDRVSAYIAEGISPFRALIEGAKATVLNRHSFAFRAAEIEQAIRELEPVLERAEGTLYTNHPRRLRGQELLGFLWSCANPGLPMVPKAWDGQSLLDGALMERPLEVFAEALAFGDGKERRYAAAITLRSAPEEGTAFSCFSGLLSLPTELTLSVAFRVASTKETEAHVATVKRINEAMRYPVTAYIAGGLRGGEMNTSKADPARTEAINEALEAKAEMSAGRLYFGNTNMTLVLYHQDGTALEDLVRATLRNLYAGKFTGAIRETVGLLSSWTVTLPGQWELCKRWMMLSSQNAVDMAPLVGVQDGERWNDHLSRQMNTRVPCLTALSTEYRTPFYFSFHSGGVGHALVLGPTGSGKSVGMNFLISQWGRYPNARALVFDKDYSCRIPTLLQGGRHIDLRPGATIRLNPMRLATEARHRAFLVGWIESLIGARGYRVTTKDSQAIAAGVADVGTRRDSSLIRLSGLLTQLDTHLRDELAPWVHEGPGGAVGSFAHYFDNVEDDLSLEGALTAIEMNDVMRVPAVGRAFLDYAFHRLRMLLENVPNGAVFPTLIYVEEAWFLMQDEQFLDRLIDWLKTFRKLNACVVMATQSLEDVTTLSPRVLAALRDNVPTRIFLPNASAASDSSYPLYRRAMGLTDEQIGRIAHGQPREDYFIVKPGIARMVKMKLTPYQVAVCRSDQRAQRTFDRYHDPARPPEAWADAYIQAMLEE